MTSRSASRSRVALEELAQRPTEKLLGAKDQGLDLVRGERFSTRTSIDGWN